MRVFTAVAVTLFVALGSAAGAGPARSGYQPARLVVGYGSGAGEAVTVAERALGLKRLARVDQLGLDVLTGDAGALGSLRAEPGVRFAYLDTRVRALRISNDPFWSGQWSPVKVHAPAAWDRGVGSASLVVAVVDTGIAPATPDLRGRVLAGTDFVNGDDQADDDNGHGTAVAGIVAAAGDNGIGVAGYCWQCRVLPVKVLGADGTGFFSDVARGIVWATDHGARIVNASLGGPAEDAAVTAAAQYAAQHGALVVAAAGNDSSDTLSYPAALPNVLSVGASDPADHLYGFSNRGAAIAAPGDNVTTALDGYEEFLGTSSAAPVVSGAAALLFSALPSATPGQVVTALEQSATPLGGVVFGRIDVAAALQLLAPAAPAPPPAATSPPPAVTKPPAHAAAKKLKRTVLAGKLGRQGRVIRLAAAAGPLRAVLTSRSHARLRLQLRRGRRLVAARKGKRKLILRRQLRAGIYRILVTGPTGLRFHLTVTYRRKGSAGPAVR
jgi:subtilisin family serine protease